MKNYQARVKRLEERFGIGGRPCPRTCLVCLVAAESGAPALCDRRSFTIKLEELIAESRRGGAPFPVSMKQKVPRHYGQLSGASPPYRMQSRSWSRSRGAFAFAAL